MKRILRTAVLACSTALWGCSALLAPSLDELGPMPAATEDQGELALVQEPEALPESPDTPTPVDLWDRVRSGFALDLDIDNPRVAAQRNWYARHQGYLDRVATRAARYLHHIVTEAEKRGVPLELALLPVVESAFDPFAYSHGRAAGPWQFIPSTGTHFGLHQNWWYDGRRDIVASTDAALTYLEQLAARFDGDWLLALASYNAGAGTVSRAVRRNAARGRPTDFWHLDLPKETSAYVPKLIAISQIVRDPARYGVTLKEIPDTPYFAVVDVDGQIDLAQAATLAGITLEELYLLNPGFSRWATPPEGPHRLLVPVDHADAFRERLAALPAEERMRWERYTIRSGDSLIAIANRFQTTPDILRSVNKLRGNTIIAGDTLLIPRASRAEEVYTLSAGQRLDAVQNRAVPGRDRHEYRVRPGDSFWKISREYGVGVRELAKWNDMAPGDPLRVGQTLVIWSDRPASAVPAAARPEMIRQISYAVRRGDSLSRIASRFNVTVGQIAAWNRLDVDRYLRPGQRLTLYVDVRNAH